MTKVISLIVPVFNEEETINIFYRTVRKELILPDCVVEIVFINDGSRDKTESIINGLAQDNELVKAFSFTRNFGKESALFCGLEHCSGDCAIPIDVDLQDPIDVIPKMISKWNEGYDVVLAKRTDRSSDSFLKRKSAEYFYKLDNYLSSTHIEENVGDFRLLDRSMVKIITSLPERNLFMKGLLSWGGGKTAIVEYKRAPRVSGTLTVKITFATLSVLHGVVKHAIFAGVYR